MHPFLCILPIFKAGIRVQALKG